MFVPRDVSLQLFPHTLGIAVARNTSSDIVNRVDGHEGLFLTCVGMHGHIYSSLVGSTYYLDIISTI